MKLEIPASPILSTVVSHIPARHVSLWRSGQVQSHCSTLLLPSICIDELSSVLKKYPGTLLTAVNDLSGLQQCRKFTDAIEAQLAHQGSGVALVDGFPVENYSEFDNRRISALFAALIAPLMEQNAEGSVLLDLKSTQPTRPDTIPVPELNQALGAGTDGGWLSAPACYVGLYCVSGSGRDFVLTSLADAFDAMSHRVNVRQLLCAELPWAEPGRMDSKQVPVKPLFELSHSAFLGRYCASDIRLTYKTHSLEMPVEAQLLLSVIETQLASQVAVNLHLEPGQFLFTNNRTVVRSSDASLSAEDGMGHLVRFWYR